MNIDFVEPKLPSRRAWILASLPMALAAVLWCVSIALNARVEAMRAQLVASELAARTQAAPPALPRPVPAYQADAAIAVKRAALPEAEALSELEHVEVAGIQLKSIDVNPAQNTVVVELDAASDGALGDYLDQLNAGQEPPKWNILKLAAGARTARAAGGEGIGAQADLQSVSLVRVLQAAQP